MPLTKTQKWLLILTPIVAAVSYFVYTAIKGGKSTIPQTYPKPNTPTSQKLTIDVPSTPQSEFPLKVGTGSRANPNKSVMALQDALGVTIDGIFGSKTLAALKEQANLTQIDNAQQLSDTIDKIYQQDSVSNYEPLTQDLINKYNSNTNLQYLNITGETTWQLLLQQPDGSFNFGNQQWAMPSGTQKDITMFSPDVEDFGTGKLVIMDSSAGNGTYQYWLADPTVIYLS